MGSELSMGALLALQPAFADFSIDFSNDDTCSVTVPGNTYEAAYEVDGDNVVIYSDSGAEAAVSGDTFSRDVTDIAGMDWTIFFKKA